jgi:hypothetical protein
MCVRPSDQDGWAKTATHTFAGEVDGIAISSDGKTFAVSSKPMSLSFWSVAGFNLRREITLPRAGWKLAMSFEGDRLAVGTWDRSVQVWDTRSIGSDMNGIHQVLDLAGHTQLITGEAFDSTGSLLASASMDGNVRLWDMSQTDYSDGGAALASRRRCLLTLECPSGDPAAIAFLPCEKGDALAAGLSNGKVLIWERSTFAPSFDGQVRFQQELRHLPSY